MSLNPLTPVTDYQSMLNRIFWFTAAAALAGTWLLRVNLPKLDSLLEQIDFTLAFGDDKILPIPGGYLLPALAVGLTTRIYRLHARISDLLNLRACFDVDVIIAEFARQLDVDLAHVSQEELFARRHDIMRRAFYPFVSGPTPQIDQGLVLQALDAWSWFWVGLEATLVFLVTGFALIAGGADQPGLMTLAATLLTAALALPAMRTQCIRYAIAQVRAILADPKREPPVRATFTNLLTAHTPSRRAA
jgi:hypothetical protein